MNRFFIAVIFFGWVALSTSCSDPNPPVNRGEHIVLVIADSASQSRLPYRQMVQTWREMESINNVVESDRADLLEEDSLRSVSALVLAGIDVSTLSARQMADIERYVQMGGGLVLVDARNTMPLSWPWWEHVAASQPSASSATPVADVQPTASREPLSANIQWHSFTAENDWQQVINTAIGTNQYQPQEAVSPRAPEDSRFTIKVLDSVMVEPMEMTILPDGKVIYIERRGRMKMYLPEEEKTIILHEFDVCTSGNYEDGLLGLTIDPDFEENHYLYLYYAPGSDCSIKSQYLSRFTMIGDSINIASEKVVLKVDVQRETCCHSGGSLTWDADGNLYLSTGDNTSSKESDGYSPLDERPGRGPYDSQKSSANTHDLRGKILRIRPNEYGSYEIPEGNLFPSDGSQGRPEIYVMGARNPFRIAVDWKTGFVYWGDVGPDVGEDGKYGPESFDEWNQARTPGYYGWPYFVGNNFSYRTRDFDMDTVGDVFDPLHPVNNSPNNTGQKNLPPARPAFIWYPKGPSAEFPQVGVGSNSAMAGPIYHRDLYPADSEVKFPEYFDGKWFIYEWARSWIQVVSFEENGDLARIEPFLPEWKISKPIDMEFGPDGALYVLEYGQNYFADNPDARLVRIEYAAANRKPVAVAQADQPAGAAPLTVAFSAAGSFDYDTGDSLQYAWDFGDGTSGSGLHLSHTYEQDGEYQAVLTVTDTSGATGSASLDILVGNAVPEVTIAWEGNRSFFFTPSVTYSASAADPEDQANGGIRPQSLSMRYVYLPDVRLLANMTVDEALNQGNFTFQRGKELIENSDCSSCHAMDASSVGPSYYAIADRYRGDYDMVGYLANKIITGGNGNWGEKIMAGHPQLSLDETTEMVRYLLSLEKGKKQGQLANTGTFRFQDHASNPGGGYLIEARYTDTGKEEIPAQTGTTLLMVRDPKVKANTFDAMQGLVQLAIGPDRDQEVMGGINRGNWLMFRNWDLRGVAALDLDIVGAGGGTISVRQGSPDGPELGRVVLPNVEAAMKPDTYRVRISPTESQQDVYIVGTGEGRTGLLDMIRVVPAVVR